MFTSNEFTKALEAAAAKGGATTYAHTKRAASGAVIGGGKLTLPNTLLRALADHGRIVAGGGRSAKQNWELWLATTLGLDCTGMTNAQITRAVSPTTDRWFVKDATETSLAPLGRDAVVGEQPTAYYYVERTEAATGVRCAERPCNRGGAVKAAKLELAEAVLAGNAEAVEAAKAKVAAATEPKPAATSRLAALEAQVAALTALLAKAAQ